MKNNLIIGFSFIFIILMLAGCHDKNEPGPIYYYGRVLNLNQGDGCQNIIEIIKKSEDGKLEAGATLSFNIELYDNPLKVGDEVHFKIIEYKNFEDIITTANCAVPQYAAIIEFCNM